MPYSPHGGGRPPGNDSSKVLGIVSLVLGVIGIPAACCCWPIGALFALGALACGIIGFVQVKDRPDQAASDAKPFLIGGIVLGGVVAVLTVLSLVYGVASFMSDSF